MKKIIVAISLLVMVANVVVAADKANLSPKATGRKASTEQSAHPLSKINDVVFFSATQYWSSWHGSDYYGQYEWVELDWSENEQFVQCVCYWAESGDSIVTPNDAYLAYWTGTEWVKSSTLTAAVNKISTTDIDITSNKVRLYMKSDKACGIRELRLLGYQGTGCSAATLSAKKTTIAYTGTPVTLAPSVTLPDGEEEVGIWFWTLPNGKTATTATVTADTLGTYTAYYTRGCGNEASITYTLFDPAVSYTWPKYSPTLDYNYRYEYPNGFPAPTKILPETSTNNIKGYMADGWWAIEWGPKCSHYVTDAAKKGILAKMNEDFAYFRDVMGWPPDKRARNGYYSTICVYGSGLYNDNADSTATGGWQGATWYNGESWPMVDISYYPIACFDPAFTYDKYQGRTVTDQTFQQNACVHEGIHAIFADLQGCKNSAWYQEAGNTWLQGEAEVVKTGKEPTSMGYLSAGNMIAPFMPIECYSGWLLDDSFGGPSAEGVNMYNSTGAQVCTWRNMLGGVQYGELFPHFLSEILGRNSIAWIWRYCKNRVLENMADSLGEKQMRHLILEYRSRQALIDVGSWTTACRQLLNDNWLLSVKQEWSPYWKAVKEWKATPYANMYKCAGTDSIGWYYPEYRTTPGWSGANQIPLHVSGAQGDIISIHFKPLGENMVCQLCYRTRFGRKFYSLPVEGEGDVVMQLQDVPANKVVFAVVCNTDYIYNGEETRKQHFDYRLKMGENVYAPAYSQVKWYAYPSTLTDPYFRITGDVNNDKKVNTTDVKAVINVIGGGTTYKSYADINSDGNIDVLDVNAIINIIVESSKASAKFSLNVGKTEVSAGEELPVNLAAASQLQVPVALSNAKGQIVYQQSFMRDGDYHLPADLAPGTYTLKAVNGNEESSVTITVK